MKKTTAIFLTLILGATMLAACSAESATQNLTGKYVMISMKLDDDEYIDGVIEGLGEAPYIELKSGNKLKSFMADYEGKPLTVNGTYKVKGDTITISYESGDSNEAKIEGTRITLEFDGDPDDSYEKSVMVYEKQ